MDLFVYRLPDLVTFYTDAGVLSRSTLAELYPSLAAWSLHAVAGSQAAQQLLVAIAVLGAVSLLVGYRTRLATLLTLVLFASLLARNPFVVNGGDTILLSFLLLGLFVPLGRRWSIDSHRRNGGEQPDRRVCSLATATVLVHFVAIYAVNAALKFQSDGWLDGTAVPRIFQLERYLWLVGPFVADLTTVLVVLNWAWMLLLAASVLLVVVTDRLRIALVAAFVTAQFGMAITLRLGVFPLVMIATLLLFLPSSLWDRVETALPIGAVDRVGSRLVSGLTRGRRGVVNASPITGSKGDATAIAVPDGASARYGRRLALVSFLVAMVGWHAITVGLVDSPAAGADIDPGSESWSFFAPNAPDTYDWFAVEATLESGDRVDLIHGSELTLDRPPDPMETYPTVLWKRYGSELRYAGATTHEGLARELCDRTDDVVSLTIYAVEQPVDPDGPAGEPSIDARYQTSC